jgi:hypothetical protein
MPAQLKKTFIGLVSDQIEEQRVVESLAKSNRVLSRYLRDLMAAALNRQSEAGWTASPESSCATSKVGSALAVEDRVRDVLIRR